MFVQLLGVTHFCDIFNNWLKPPPSQDAHTVDKHSETAAGVAQSPLVTINRVDTSLVIGKNSALIWKVFSQYWKETYAIKCGQFKAKL